jgi:hypothetical protein
MEVIKNISTRLGYIFVIAFWVIIIMSLSSCDITYQLSDSEYSDAREEHTSLTYYNSQIYWGWNEGFYYYYGTPHYYPWYYYYNSCPPSHHNNATHVIITRPVNKPTHRPSINNHRPNIKTNSTRVKVTPNRNTKVKTNTNYTRPKTNVKTNTRVKTNRRPR